MNSIKHIKKFFSLNFIVKSWQVITAILILILVLSLYIVSPEKSNFSVISQRNDNKKSSSIKDKWDGKGNIIDMIWQ